MRDEYYDEQARSLIFAIERTPPPTIERGNALFVIPPERVWVRCDKFPAGAVPATAVAEAELPGLVAEGASQEILEAWYVQCPNGCSADDEHCNECPEDRGAVKARLRVNLPEHDPPEGGNGDE